MANDFLSMLEPVDREGVFGRVLEGYGRVRRDARHDLDLSNVSDEGKRREQEADSMRAYGFYGLGLKRERWLKLPKGDAVVLPAYCFRPPNTPSCRSHTELDDLIASSGKAYPILACFDARKANSIASPVATNDGIFKCIVQVEVDSIYANPEVLEVDGEDVKVLGIYEAKHVTSVNIWIKKIG